MSEANVELHRQANEAFNSRDIEAYVAYCDPTIELHSAVTVPGGGFYRGHDGVRRWHRDLEDVFGEEIRVEAEAYFERSRVGRFWRVRTSDAGDCLSCTMIFHASTTSLASPGRSTIMLGMARKEASCSMAWNEPGTAGPGPGAGRSWMTSTPVTSGIEVSRAFVAAGKAMG